MRKNFAEKDPIRLTPDRKSEQFVAQILQREDTAMILDRADRQPSRSPISLFDMFSKKRMRKISRKHRAAPRPPPAAAAAASLS